MYFEEAKISQKDGKDAAGYQTKDENENKPIIVQPITGMLLLTCFQSSFLLNHISFVGMEEKIYWDEERRRDTKKKK